MVHQLKAIELLGDLAEYIGTENVSSRDPFSIGQLERFR